MPKPGSFNGATVFQPWRHLPRYGRGPRAQQRSFNGATVFQPWRRNCGRSSAYRQAPSFNGATVFQPWRPDPRRDSEWYEATKFQWSHGFSTMETKIGEARPAKAWEGFNGATVFQPWRPLITKRPAAAKRILVSMEPRFFNHGDALRFFAIGFRWERFQWSHGFSTMETHYPRPVHRRWRDVSMEPRFFNHGDQTRDGLESGMKPESFNGATVFQPWRHAHGQASIER